MKKIIVIILLQSVIYGCDNRKFNIDNNNEDYKSYRKNFENDLISQFPDSIIYENVKLVSNTNRKKNDIGLLLYEYNIDSKIIDSIKQNFSDKSIAKYKADDNCLLIVNKFETKHTYRNFKKVKTTEALKDIKGCEGNIFPIPNFIESESDNIQKNKNGINLDESFEIYVLEAKEGNHWKNYNLSPAPQMPINWKNGYSKGIAISKKQETVIYWSIMW